MKNLHSLSGLALAGLLYLAPHSTSAQWTNVGTAGFSAGSATYQTMALGSDGTPYVGYNDQSLGTSGQGVVMKYNGTAWVSVGAAGFTTGTAEHGSLTVAPGDTLYFSYQDGPSGMAAVMKFNGSSWEQVGSTGISTGMATYTCMEVSNTGTPYIAYVDAASNRACVKMFDGTNWVNVGPTAEVSAAGASYLGMDLDAAGLPWIGFSDGANGNNSTVMRFDGTTWSTAGTPGFSASLSGIIYMDLTIGPDNEVYVAYSNPFAGVTASVQKFDGTTWNLVGAAGITSGSVFNTIAVDTDGVPYLAFMDNPLSSKGSVKKYDASTSTWDYLGTAGFTGTGAGYLNSVIDGNTYLYVSNSDGDMGGKTSVMRYQLCTPATYPVIAPVAAVCEGDTVTLTLTGTLNDDANWQWYTGGCKNLSAGTGTSLNIVANDTVTFYANGDDVCVYAADSCASVTINPLATPAVPVITETGAVLTSSAASGNQWALNGTDIPGATGATYNVPVQGWYTVTVTNANGCSSTSDSLFALHTTGLNETAQQVTGSVYPVPFTGVLNITLGTVENAGIVINDPQGKTVFTATANAKTNSFDLAHLVPGIYFVSITQNSGSETFRIVKQ